MSVVEHPTPAPEMKVSPPERISGTGTPGDPIHVEIGTKAPGGEFSDIGFVTSSRCGRLWAALAKAQAEFKAVEKDRENPFFHSRYATLSAVCDMIRVPLTSNGLAYTQPSSVDGNRVTVVTLLAHGESGEWMSSTITACSEGMKVQQIGSTITYLKRYALSAMLGITPDEDDDGNGASFGEDEQPRARQQSRLSSGKAKAKSEPEPKPKPEPVKEEPSYMILARILAKKYGGKNVEDYSLLITSAYEDPAMTWDHVKAHPDLSIQVSDALQRYCETHSVEPGDLLGRLRASIQEQI